MHLFPTNEKVNAHELEPVLCFSTGCGVMLKNGMWKEERLVNEFLETVVDIGERFSKRSTLGDNGRI